MPNQIRQIGIRLIVAAAMLAAAEFPANADDSAAQRVAASLAARALANSGAMEIVTSLTTEIGPRLDGSPAEKRAAEWAKERLKRMGFDRVWIEPFQLQHGWVRGIETAELIRPAPQPLVVTALGGSVPTPPEGIEAEVALFRTYDEMLAAPPGSLAGKIAVVTQAMPRTQDGSGYGYANKIRTQGPSEAARRGAIAYMLRSLATDSHRVAHTGVTDYQEGVTRIPAAAMSVPDAEQLDRLAAAGGALRIKLVLTPRDLGPVSSQNVIAEITGREKAEETVLLGAHLDSWDLGTGAIDDGAGVAIVVTAAKLIADLPQRPKRTIRVVLYGSEETGLFGANAYLETHKAELNHLVVVAEADEGQGPVFRFRTGVTNAQEATLVQIRAALVPLGIMPGDNSSRGSSDVEPLAEAGVPAVTLDLDTTDYFDLHHTSDDTVDKIEPARINQSAAAYAVFTYLAAELGGNYRAASRAAK